jgi:predicted RNA polymerase sigma factor
VTLEPLLRELAPQVLASIIRRYRDVPAAEDAVQEALIAAAAQWPTEGVPENPRGWLLQVSAWRITDHVRRDVARRRREEIVVGLVPGELQVAPVDLDAPPDRDDSLALLFMCCHPALTTPSAIALTLRAVGGLTAAEIARAFFVPEATMAQRISRAKQTIKTSGVPFALPAAGERAARLEAVLHVLYLIFNEGYASSGAEVARTDLSTEAIRLARMLHAALPDDAEVAGLLALMLLTDARRPARTGPHGELVPLDEQDRGAWDRRAIAEGVALLEATLPRGQVGAYQLQAAVAAVHDEAARAADTDWAQIVALYGVLEQLTGNPLVTLNRAVALAMVDGPRAGLAALAPIERDERITSTHRLDAVRAHLHELAGDRDEALRCYEAAAARTTSTPERN